MTEKEKQLAQNIREITYGTNKTRLSNLLKYILEQASDEYIEEEFYHNDDKILEWLALTGVENWALQIRAYIKRHPQIFICRKPGCNGKIVGECSKLYCNICHCKYLLHLDYITENICEECIARKLNECTTKNRHGIKDIYCILEDEYDRNKI